MQCYDVYLVALKRLQKAKERLHVKNNSDIV